MKELIDWVLIAITIYFREKKSTNRLDPIVCLITQSKKVEEHIQKFLVMSDSIKKYVRIASKPYFLIMFGNLPVSFSEAERSCLYSNVIGNLDIQDNYRKFLKEANYDLLEEDQLRLNFKKGESYIISEVLVHEMGTFCDHNTLKHLMIRNKKLEIFSKVNSPISPNFIFY